MLYIHTLKDLNPKSAEIESVMITREIKDKNSYPLVESKVNDHFSVFFISQTDIENMQNALQLIPSTVELIEQLPQAQGWEFEIVNIERASAALKEMPEALQNNINYAQSILNNQIFFAPEVTMILNKLPTLKSQDDRQKYEQRIKALFAELLRTSDFRFQFTDIVNEGQVERMNALVESMEKGFFFPVKLEEHLKKQDFTSISQRFPVEQIQKVHEITDNIKLIQKGVTRAYEHNMRMINQSVVLYSYIKWLRGF